MASLLNQNDEPLHDAADGTLKKGCLVTDSIYGEGGISAVKWAVPSGFQVAPEPAVLDHSLVGSAIYMRWEKYGWQLGRITQIIGPAFKQLSKKFNYRITWSDGHKGPGKLGVEN